MAGKRTRLAISAYCPGCDHIMVVDSIEGEPIVYCHNPFCVEHKINYQAPVVELKPYVKRSQS